MRRRSLFKWSGLGILGLWQSRAQAQLAPTPAQGEGPFYPVTSISSKDQDLTRVEGSSQAAAGEVIEIMGRVLDRDERPVSGAVVEMWQTDSRGRYNHPGHSSSNQLDPNFQYFCRVLTDNQGRFKIKTIRPGVYPGRPRHIHWKVHPFGKASFTTQTYFTGEGGTAALQLAFDKMSPDGNPMTEWTVVLA